MFYSIDAAVHGGTAALVVTLPAIILSWRMTGRLADGPRALRSFVTCSAAYGLIAALGGAWAFVFERSGFADEAAAGALIAGGAAVAVAFPILLLLPHKA